MKSPAKIVRDGLAALIGSARRETDLDKLTAALGEARGQIEAAARDRDAAETAYRDGLLDATPAELERLQAVKGRATIDLDRAEALAAALVTRIASVREAEARAARQAIHADAVAKVEAIRARLPVEYAHHALALRHLLRDLAEAECARDRAAKEAPDFPAVASPEIELRALHGLAEEIVERESVDLWCIDGRTDPVPAERQGDVRAYPEDRTRGSLQMVGSSHPFAPTSGVNLACTLRAYTRTRYREAVQGFRHEALHRTVSLPGFGLNDPAFVVLEPLRDHHGALIDLAADLPPPVGRSDRPVLERLELLPAVPRAEAEVVPLRGAA